MTEMEKLAAGRRARRGADRPAPEGHEWGTCQSVHQVGRSRTRTVARVLLASGFVVTAYLAPGLATPSVDAPVLVDHVAGGDAPVGTVIVANAE